MSYPTSGAAPTVSAKPATATITYDASTQTYTLTVDGRSQTFLPSHIDPAQSNAAITVYIRKNGSTTDSLTITRPGTTGLLTYKYVGSAYWQRTVDEAATISGHFDAVTYGMRTADAAVPRSGQAHYDLSMLGAFTQPGSVASVAGDGALQVDFTSGRMALNVAIGRTGGITGVMQGSGTLGSGNSLSGTFLSRITSNNFAGVFNGSFFGPSAEEVGAAFNGRDAADGMVLVGTLMGRKAGSSANSAFDALSTPQFFSTVSNRVAFDRTGDTTAAANVTAGSSALVIGYDPASSFTGALFNFFTPEGVIRRPATADRFRQNFGYAGVGGQIPQSWTQYNVSDFKYLKAGRLVSITGSRYTFDDFVIGFPSLTDALPTGRAGYLAELTGTLFNSAEAPVGLKGQTLLSVDFATGRLTATGDVRSFSDSRVFGSVNATAQLSSGSSGFSGAWKVDGSTPFAGAWNGGFFGPQGQEVGATWRADAGAGSLMTGVIFGKRDDRVIATQAPLSQLTAETELRGSAGIFYETGGSPSYGYNQDDVVVAFNPATGTYTFKSATTHNLGLAERINASFGPGERVAAESNDSFDVYRSADGSREARIARLSGPNRELDLTYMSFATVTQRRPDGTRAPLATQYFVPFGLPTPEVQMPRAGSASYTGRAYGAGYVAGIGENARVTGSMTAKVDFGLGSVNALLNLVASNPNGALANVALGEFALNAQRSVNTFSGGGSGQGYDYTLNGKFFGPDAAEIGSAFTLRRNGPPSGSRFYDVEITGGFAGKKK